MFIFLALICLFFLHLATIALNIKNRGYNTAQ